MAKKPRASSGKTLREKIGRDSLSYVHPNQYDWHEDDEQLNRLHFNEGSFVVMYPDRFEEEVQVDENGVFTFTSPSRCVPPLRGRYARFDGSEST